MNAAADFLRRRLSFQPRVFIILGSGLGALANEISDAAVFPYESIPGFAPSTVEGHSGRLLCGRLEGVPVLAMQGRFHIYEGHDAATVAAPVRTAAALGVRTMIVSNAAGGINRDFQAGDLMLIDDHINLMWQNPLTGPVVAQEVRFPDMSAPYDPALQALALRVAQQHGLRLQRGVYLAAPGPAYETPAEIRMYERLGADAVGMSTVPEVLVARVSGLAVLGLSLISNLAAGYAQAPLSHGEVIEEARAASVRFNALVRGIVAQLS